MFNSKSSQARYTRRATLATCALPALLHTSWALAQTTIDDERSSPIATSTVNGGVPADVTVTQDGSLVFENRFNLTAISVDSNNILRNDGFILFEEGDDLTAVSIGPGLTTSYVGFGDISLIEDYTREDLDDDGDLDGPFALGANKFGILIEAGDSVTGGITLEPGASILIEGNQSAGIWLRSALAGPLTLDGTISVVGDDARGLDVEQAIGGDVLLSSSISVQGQNARAVRLAGAIDGNLTIESSLSSTGFASTSLSNYVAPDNVDEDTPTAEELRDADDLFDNNGTLEIGGSVRDGILINGIIDTFVDEEEAEDETKDTIEDFDVNRTTGSLTSFGPAPAFVISPDIGATQESIIIGPVRESVRDTTDDDEDEDFSEVLAQFSYSQSLINRGSISARGINIGVPATAFRLSGSKDGSLTSTLTGGILNSGSIDAEAVEADSVAVDIKAGGFAGDFVNSGVILSSVFSSSTNTANAIRIEDQASLVSLTNTGTITASAFFGLNANAIAIEDRSGTLRNITTSGIIQALYEPTEGQSDSDVDFRSGKTIAIDLSTHTIGEDVSITLFREEPVDDLNGDGDLTRSDTIEPEIIGDVLLGAGNDSIDARDGTIFGSIDFGQGDASFSLQTMEYVGDTLFHSGLHDVSISRSFAVGALSFSEGSGSLALSDNAVFTGRLRTSDHSLGVNVDGSELLLLAGSRADVSNLTVQNESVLGFEISQAQDGAQPILDVAGRAVIGDNTTISVTSDSISTIGFSQLLIAAEELLLDDTVITETQVIAPFIYDFSVDLDQTGDVDRLVGGLTLKNPESLGLDANQSAAFAPLIALFEQDSQIGSALASLQSEEAFFDAYNSVMPRRSDAASRFLQTQYFTGIGSLQDRLHLIANSKSKKLGVWAHNNITVLNVGTDRARSIAGYDGFGLGFMGGADIPLFGLDAIGIYGTFNYGEFEEKGISNSPLEVTNLGLGIYASEQVGPLWMFLNGQVARAGFQATRNIDFGSVRETVEGDWNGWNQSASASIGANFQFGRHIFVRPSVSADYLALQEKGYSENGDTPFAFEIDGVTTRRFTGAALLSIGGIFRSKSVRYGSFGGAGTIVAWRPEISIGARTTFSHTPYDTQATIIETGERFRIQSNETFPRAFLGSAALTVQSPWFSSRFSYSLETSDEATVHTGTISVRLIF